ncbi:MAG TPA: thymidylate synthase [bacterium]|nr:thymidylate synthase [bacterium]
MLPVIKIEGETVPEVWEKSLLELWEKGISVRTEYDVPGVPESKDATMIMVVKKPFAEPRIHLGFPGGMEDLEKYRQEVVAGVHDHWINPQEKKWTYTYHDRLFNYGVPGSTEKKRINQVDYIAEKLSNAFFSRRAQAITWIPFYDPETYDPPCLQRIWCRILKQESDLFLVMNVHWRSRDAYRAAFMNIFGLTSLQEFIAGKISEKTGKKISVGQYTDIVDSYHIYGDSFEDFKNRFLNMLDKRDFYNQDRLKSRTVRSDDTVAVAGFEYGKQLLELERKSGKKGATA